MLRLPVKQLVQTKKISLRVLRKTRRLLLLISRTVYWKLRLQRIKLVDFACGLPIIGKPLGTAARKYLWISRKKQFLIVKRTVYSLVVLGIVLFSYRLATAPSYNLSSADLDLIGKADSSLMKSGDFQYQNGSYYLNKSSMGKQSAPKSFNVAVGSTNQAYSLKIGSNLSKGVSLFDNQSGLSLTMSPLFSTASAKLINNHLVYPVDSIGGADDTYTVKANGLQEDILLNKPTSTNKLLLRYKLNLPSYLAARSLPNGAIGIYSANPVLFGNISYGDNQDKSLVAKAKTNSQKNYLLFALLPPEIKSIGSSTTDLNGSTASLRLKGNILTLSASHLASLTYPLDIDPSILVASASTFQASGNNESDISFGTSSVSEAGLTGGIVGSWAATTTFSSSSPTMPPRSGAGTVAYNGYLYVLGGGAGSGSGDCNLFIIVYLCDGVYYAPINSNGSVGSWSATTTFPLSGSTIMPQREYFGTAAYNGYLYVLGGYTNGTSGDCSSDYCDGVFDAPINSDGTIGSWSATTSFPSSSPVMPGRYGLQSVAYDGYLYALGGIAGSSSGDCGTGSDYCDGVFYAPINSDGTIGSWSATTTFPSSSPTMVARYDFGATTYDGYLYVTGGTYTSAGTTSCSSNSDCASVFYAPINSNGTIGSWSVGTSFVTTDRTRGGLGFIAYNGYLYVSGGKETSSGDDCTATLYYCNGVYYAPINSNGSVGSWSATTTFPSSSPTMVARENFGTAAYNGYIYVVGGVAGTSSGDCTASQDQCNGAYVTQIQSAGSLGTVSSSGTLSTNRTEFGFIAYNGYVYMAGGKSGTSGSDCTTGSGPYYCNGVYYATINSAGAIGSWTQDTTATFPAGMPARVYSDLVAYNGYLYSIGGVSSSSSGDCTASGACNGVWYSQINSSGIPQAWTQDTTATFPAGMPGRDDPAFSEYNGYIYLAGGQAPASTGDCNSTYNYCNGVWISQINSSGIPGAWTQDTTATFPAGMPPRGGLRMTIANGYAYLMGGWSNTTSGDCATSDYCNGVWISQITASSGALGGWTSTTSLPTAKSDFATFVYNGNLYIFGGAADTSSGDCTATGDLCNGMEFAPIGNSGTIGSWVQSGTFPASSPTMPAREDLGFIVYNGTVNLFGGTAGTATGDCNFSHDYCNGIYTMSINDGGAGNVGSWASNTAFSSTTSGTMPARDNFGTLAYNGYIYVVGGQAGSSGGDCTAASNFCNGVWSAAISAGTGTLSSWTEVSTFTAGTMPAREGEGVVAYDGYLYVMGGESGASSGDCTYYTPYYMCNGVYYASLGSGGTLGSWNSGTGFPTGSTMPARSDFGVAVYNDNLYVLGGSSGGANAGDCLSATSNWCNGVFYSSLASNGSNGSWNTTTGFSSSLPMPARVGLESVAYDGYLYVVGGLGYTSAGDCTGASNYCDGVFYSPINSNGTINNWQETTSLGNGNIPGRRLFDLTASNGYLYVAGGQSGASSGDCTATNDDCNGTFYAPINNGGTIGNWESTTTFPSGSPTMPARIAAGSVLADGYLFVLGGQAAASSGDCTATNNYCNGVYSTSVQTISHVGTYSDLIDLAASYINGYWNSTANMGTTVMNTATIAYNGYLYEIGGYGCSGSFCSTSRYAPINANGTLGSWNTTGALPSGIAAGAAVVYNGYMYYLGGFTGSGTAQVLYTQVNSNGTLPNWSTTTNLPSINAFETAVVNNGFIDVIGGNSGSSNLTAVDYAKIDTSNGKLDINGPCSVVWCATTSLGTGTAMSASVIYNNYIYDLGNCTNMTLSAGSCNSGVTDTVFYAAANSNGTVGTWGSANTMPSNLAMESAAVYDGYVYAMGGINNSGTTLSSVYYAPLASNGTVGTWQTSQYVLPDSDNESSAAVYDGYVYMTGGYDSSSTILSSTWYASLIDPDPLPNNLILLGTNSDNPGINEVGNPGAGGISIQYENAGYLCPQFASLNNVSTGISNELGTPFSLNVSGNDCSVTTGLVAEMWVKLLLDDSQTASFPDVNSNHTTINSVQIDFTANRVNRLRGGMTLQNGTQGALN